MAKKKSSPGCPLWMVTLGDVSALMLTFFVMLLSFSSFKEQEARRKVMGVMEGATGRPTFKEKRQNRSADSSEKSQTHRKQGGQHPQAPGTLDKPEIGKKTTPRSIRKRFEERESQLKSKKGEKSVTYSELKDGVHIRIGRASLFKSPRKNPRKLRQQASNLLAGARTLAANIDNEIRIVDCIPKQRASSITGKQWGDALERTSRLGQLFQEEFNFEKERFGYGIRIVEPGKPPFIELVIAGEIGTNEISYGKLTKVIQ